MKDILFNYHCITTYIKLFSPLLISIFINSISMFRTNKDSGKIVKFRPPGFVFGIVWFILYLLFGFSWILNDNIFF